MNENKYVIEKAAEKTNDPAVVVYLNQIHLTGDSVQLQGLITELDADDFSIYAIIREQKYDAKITC